MTSSYVITMNRIVNLCQKWQTATPLQSKTLSTNYLKQQNHSHNYAVSPALDMFSHTAKIALYSHAQKSIKLRKPFDFKGFQNRSILPVTVKPPSQHAAYTGTDQKMPASQPDVFLPAF